LRFANTEIDFALLLQAAYNTSQMIAIRLFKKSKWLVEYKEE
jgi:hypothetical protein